MAILDKPLDDLTEADFQALVGGGVAERKTIEYKSALPGEDADEKKEYLADVSSFANASGGHLIFGIEAKDGIPTRLSGLMVASADQEILRLDTMVRDGLQPRIPGHYTQPVPLTSGGILVVMRIPRSWNAPHMVTFRNWSRFFARASNGKYQLDVGEIRAAFLRSETFAGRVRDFRADRLAKVVANDTPIQLADAPRLMLHSIPFGASDPGTGVDVTAIEEDSSFWGLARPIGSGTSTHWYNFDGYLAVGKGAHTQDYISYLQVFRNGSIEAVNADVLHLHDRPKRIPSVAFEHYLLDALPNYLAIQQRLGVEPPLLVMLSLVGVGGYEMAIDNGFDIGHPIDRDTLVVPEVLIEHFDRNVAQLMRPCFDAVWNAAGWPRSRNYDAEGRWKRAGT